MVPAKDTREVCHQLYRSSYIDLLQLSANRQHNPSSTIYLWGVDKKRFRRKCTEDVAAALLNVCLRRLHEIEEVGSHWLERERTLLVAEADENDNETDRVNYYKFKLGLERLDVAALQLDETLLLMIDYKT
jgi:DNA-directed RNA polymerase III subunit RPC3